MYKQVQAMDSEAMDSEAMDSEAMRIAHARQLIPDYVLGLLSADDSRRVEQHARQCPLCREAIQRERLVEFRVRGAVQLAARPPAGRLEALRPAFPRPATRARRSLYRQFAPVMALVMLLVVVLLAQVGGYGLPTPGFARATKAPTSTATPSPTASPPSPTATLAANATAAPAALTRVSRLSAPSPAPEPAPRLSSEVVLGTTLSDPTAAATPIITLAR